MAILDNCLYIPSRTTLITEHRFITRRWFPGERESRSTSLTLLPLTCQKRPEPSSLPGTTCHTQVHRLLPQHQEQTSIPDQTPPTKDFLRTIRTIRLRLRRLPHNIPSPGTREHFPPHTIPPSHIRRRPSQTSWRLQSSHTPR